VEVPPRVCLPGMNATHDKGLPTMDDATEMLVFRDETGAFYLLPRLVFEAARVPAEGVPELEAALRDEDVQGYGTRRRPGTGSVTRDGELRMIELQAVVAQRAIGVQLTTQLMASLSSTTSTITGNIGR
jgi:hypothetical protein